MVPENGQRYGPYEILGRIGGGGMGHVFRAWDARLHREVAIKLLHDEFGVAGSRERFLREAQAASALMHPNICTVFDIGEQDGEPYLAGTASPACARVSAGTAAEAGVSDGDKVTVATERGALTLPVEVTDMPDRVVWLPANSAGCAVRAQLAAGNGTRVTLRSPE